MGIITNESSSVDDILFPRLTDSSIFIAGRETVTGGRWGREAKTVHEEGESGIKCVP